MITQLSIENIALIEKLDLELKNGLNILSGETGAGKSIIIDSLNFVLGERADKSLIRFGTDYAVVQAVFEDYENEQIKSYLDDIGIETEDVLIIRRKMSVDGKNECRINGRVSTLSILKGLTELLVDIHGQHEHQSLLKPSNHIILLDSIGSKEIDKEKANVKAVYDEYTEVRRQLLKFGDAAERARKLDILSYQINEIENADIKENEEENLLAQRKKIRNMEKILGAYNSAKNLIDGYDGDSLTSRLKQCISLLSSIESFDEDVSSLNERLDSCKIELSDISDTLSDKLNELDFDERTADRVEERLDHIRAIIKKYGGSYELMNEFYQSAVEEAGMLANADDTVAELERKLEKLSVKLKETAANLTSLRCKTANKFEKDMISELSCLGMSGTTFKVDIVSTEYVNEITENGADTVEFLISPNIGEPLKPLAKIISGGEMSRFMLALKNIVAGIDGIGTMVFDEIDTGISGNILQVVSEKMCNISRNRQVIAVTHMPSLAAMADNHYLISKSVEGGKTLTHVTLLDDDTDEIARLIGGNDYSKFAVPHAKEMKDWADKYKSKL
ncbi:MAG: DNA repair protein RecN [Clostridia bacterium]|nr:DNA repair protein RecN [Clostridia bacterium]